MGCHFLLQGIFPTQGSNPKSPALASGFFDLITREAELFSNVKNLFSLTTFHVKHFVSLIIILPHDLIHYNFPCSAMQEIGFDPKVWKIPWRRKLQPTLVFLPGELHGQRSLVGGRLWGCTELDMTEAT